MSEILKRAKEDRSFRKQLIRKLSTKPQPAFDFRRSLGEEDLKVLDAFLDKKPLNGDRLSTNGKSLDGVGFLGKGIAVWKDGKIEFRAADSRQIQDIQYALEGKAPKIYLKKANSSGLKYWGDIIENSTQEVVFTFFSHEKAAQASQILMNMGMYPSQDGKVVALSARDLRNKGLKL